MRLQEEKKWKGCRLVKSKGVKTQRVGGLQTFGRLVSIACVSSQERRQKDKSATYL